MGRSALPRKSGWRALTATSRERALLIALGGWAAAVLVVTLAPTANTPPLTAGGFLCIGCSSRDTADIILNVLLFVPGGGLLTLALGSGRGVVAALCLTVLVETIQIGVPGRSPALQDLLTNTFGALCGGVLVSRGLSRRAQHAVALLVVSAWLAPAVLLVPMTTPFTLHGQWTPGFGTLERYEGRVLSANVGGLGVPTGLVRDKPTLDSAIKRRAEIDLVLEVGEPPSSFAPVFQIVDSARSTIVSLGAVGTDLVMLGHNPATVLRLDQPRTYWRNALDGTEAGDTLEVRIDRARSSTCISLGQREACQLAPSLAAGWGHLISLASAPSWVRTLAGILWSLALGLALGATAPGPGVAFVRGAALGGVGMLVSSLAPDVAPAPLQTTLLVVSTLFGSALRAPIRRLWPVIVTPLAE